MKKKPPKKDEIYEASLRVLGLVDGYLAKLPQDTLTTDGSGLMTWGELRHHIDCVLKYAGKRPKGG